MNKTLVAFPVVSTLSVVGIYGLHDYLDNTIGDSLSSDALISQDSLWERSASAYRGRSSDPKFLSVDKSQVTAQMMKDKCRSILGGRFNGEHDVNYQNAKIWCLKPMNLGQVSESLGKTIIDVNSNDSEWTTKAADSNISEIVASSDDKASELKLACWSLRSEEIWDSPSKEGIELFLKWCTK